MQELQLFQFDDHSVRVHDKDGNPWFLLNEVCEVLGISNPGNASARLDEDEKDAIHTMDSIGRQQKTILINESALYALALTSRKPKAKQFRRWITSEVIPQIRKTGSYGKPDVAELSRMDILQLAIQSEEERLRLEAKVEEDAPKVHFHDVVTRSEGLLTTAEAAKSIGTGRNRLMAFMRQSGWLRRNNEPYQDKIERGWLDVRISEFEKPTGDIAKQITPMVTSLGLTRLTDLYQQRIGEVA